MGWLIMYGHLMRRLCIKAGSSPASIATQPQMQKRTFVRVIRQGPRRLTSWKVIAIPTGRDESKRAKDAR